MPVINDTTSYTAYKRNPAQYYGAHTRGENMYDSVYNNINKEFENALFNINSGNGIFGNGNVGVVAEARNPDEHGFMKYLLGMSYINTKVLEVAATEPSLKTQIQSLKLPAIGTVVEQPVDNGDQLHRYGVILYDSVADTGIYRVITQDVIDNYNDDNSASVTEIPAVDPEETTTVRFPATDSTIFQTSCQCTPGTGACANGFRQVYIIKKRDFTPKAQTQRELAYVVDQTTGNDGTVSLTLKRGLGRAVPTDTNNDNEYTWERGLPVTLSVGDVLEFGHVVPTTQCKPKTCCTKPHPKLFHYRSSAQGNTECVYTSDASDVLVQRGDELSSALKDAYKVRQTLRDIQHRYFSTIMNGLETYGAGELRPIPVDATHVEYKDYDSIAETIRGINPTIDEFGTRLEHYFTGKYDIYGQQKIGKIMELQMKSFEGVNPFYNPAEWIAYGDIRPLMQYQAANALPYGNVVPNTMNEALNIQNMQASAFDPKGTGKSMFGTRYDANKFGLVPLRIGDIVIDGIQDDNVAANTIYIIPKDGFEIFVRNRELQKKKLGFAFDPHFATQTSGASIVPFIYTQDFVTTMDLGSNQMVYKTKDDCDFSVHAYWEFGLHPKAMYLPYMMKFTFGSKVPNPAYDPLDPLSEPYIYDNLDAVTFQGANPVVEVLNKFTGGAIY